MDHFGFVIGFALVIIGFLIVGWAKAASRGDMFERFIRHTEQSNKFMEFVLGERRSAIKGKISQKYFSEW